MASIRHYALGSCVLCWSRNPIASIRQGARTVHVAKPAGVYTTLRSDVVRTVDVAKLDLVHMTLPFYFLSWCVLWTWRNLMASDTRFRNSSYCARRKTELTNLAVRTVHDAKLDCVDTTRRPNVVRTAHVAKPDLVHMTLRFYFFSWYVLWTSRHLMASIRPYSPASCVLCTSRNRMPFSSVFSSVCSSVCSRNSAYSSFSFYSLFFCRSLVVSTFKFVVP